MSLLRKRDKGRLGRQQSLAGIPVLNPQATLETNGDCTTVKIQFEKGKSWIERFRPQTIRRRYELDEFGSFVIRLIDGKRCVMDLVHAFRTRFRMSPREAELGIVAFLTTLMKRHIVFIGVSAE
tara:strand:- start:596 stop:967 length:372 start_codon:yes stop_codon:yes gene_type:complete